MSRYSLPFLLALSLLVSACSPQALSPQSTATIQSTPALQLLGTQWSLATLQGGSLIEDTSINLMFSDGFLRGMMTCNSYGGGPDSGKYAATADGSLEVSQLAVTVQLCTEPDGIMQQEQAYIDTLQQVRAYRSADDRLELYDEAGDSILGFERQAP